MMDSENLIKLAKVAVAASETISFGMTEARRFYDLDIQDGSKSSDGVFTDVGVRAINESTAMLHRKLFPISQDEPWFSLEVDTGGMDRTTAGEMLRQKQEWESNIHKALRISSFDVDVLPALTDAQISKGVLQFFVGDHEVPIKCSSVCADKVHVEYASSGEMKAIYQKHSMTFEEAQARWTHQKAQWQGLGKTGEAKGDKAKKINFYECFTQNPNKRAKVKKIMWSVVAEESQKMVLQLPIRSSRLVVFRQDVPSGSTVGRGRAFKALRLLRVLSDFHRDHLSGMKARVLGVMQTDDEDILPDDQNIQGGEVLTVQNGARGLWPVDLPTMGALDANYAERMERSVEKMIIGPRLPDEAQGARSDYDLNLRGAEASAASLPTTIRLLRELVVPVVENVLGILSLPEMSGSPYYIAVPKGVKVVVRSPFVQAQERLDAIAELEAYNVARSINPEETARQVDHQKLMTTFYARSGLPMRSAEDVKRHDEAVAAQQKMMAAAQAVEAGQ